MKSKVETYLGFCVRSRKIAFGAEETEKQKRDVFLLLFDETLGKSSRKSIDKAKEKFSCLAFVCEEGALANLLHRPAVKAVAIKDKNLAEAIRTALESEPQFKLYSGGTD